MKFNRLLSNIVLLFYLLVRSREEIKIQWKYLTILVEAILRGLITTVAHGRRNKPGKISPFIGHKVRTSSIISLWIGFSINLGCGETSRIRLYDFHQCYRSSSFVSHRFPSNWIHSFHSSDSESQISHMAYQSLIELSEIWPNSWISKDVFNECIYSILSQVVIQRLLEESVFFCLYRMINLISIVRFVSFEHYSIITNSKKNPFDIIFNIY